MSSCSGPHHVDYFPFYDDGIRKPRVTLIPLINSSKCDLSWDISEEISQGIHHQLMDSGAFYVPSPRELGPVWGKVKEIDFFNSDICDNTVAKEFQNTDFIVAFDLIEHSTSQEALPASKNILKCPLVNRSLTLRVRIKIIDIRCEKPKIILYEIFKTCYSLTPSKNTTACEQLSWGSQGYEKSPCGIAHDRLIRSLAARLEEVIWSAK